MQVSGRSTTSPSTRLITWRDELRPRVQQRVCTLATNSYRDKTQKCRLMPSQRVTQECRAYVFIAARASLKQALRENNAKVGQAAFKLDDLFSSNPEEAKHAQRAQHACTNMYLL
eukprot:1134116-Pelagomonas_calceolata.AAC.2